MTIVAGFVSGPLLQTGTSLLGRTHFHNHNQVPSRYVQQRFHNSSSKRVQMNALNRGPTTPAPNYDHIDANPANKLLTNIFRDKLEVELGRKATCEGYDGVIEVVKALAQSYKGRPAELQAASERVLESLFPGWLPPAFSRMFSQPFPQFAAWINAVVTVAVTQWLMGPSKIAEDGVTVEIERCRYLEGKMVISFFLLYNVE